MENNSERTKLDAFQALDVISQTRLVLGENVRNHFCIMKAVNKADYTDTGIYDYVNNDGYNNLGRWVEEAAG